MASKNENEEVKKEEEKREAVAAEAAATPPAAEASKEEKDEKDEKEKEEEQKPAAVAAAAEPPKPSPEEKQEKAAEEVPASASAPAPAPAPAPAAASASRPSLKPTPPPLPPAPTTPPPVAVSPTLQQQQQQQQQLPKKKEEASSSPPPAPTPAPTPAPAPAAPAVPAKPQSGGPAPSPPKAAASSSLLASGPHEDSGVFVLSPSQTPTAMMLSSSQQAQKPAPVPVPAPVLAKASLAAPQSSFALAAPAPAPAPASLPHQQQQQEVEQTMTTPTLPKRFSSINIGLLNAPVADATNATSGNNSGSIGDLLISGPMQLVTAAVTTAAGPAAAAGGGDGGGVGKRGLADIAETDEQDQDDDEDHHQTQPQAQQRQEVQLRVPIATMAANLAAIEQQQQQQLEKAVHSAFVSPSGATALLPLPAGVPIGTHSPSRELKLHQQQPQITAPALPQAPFGLGAGFSLHREALEATSPALAAALAADVNARLAAIAAANSANSPTSEPAVISALDGRALAVQQSGSGLKSTTTPSLSGAALASFLASLHSEAMTAAGVPTTTTAEEVKQEQQQETSENKADEAPASPSSGPEAAAALRLKLAEAKEHAAAAQKERAEKLKLLQQQVIVAERRARAAELDSARAVLAAAVAQARRAGVAVYPEEDQLGSLDIHSPALAAAARAATASAGALNSSAASAPASSPAAAAAAALLASPLPAAAGSASVVAESDPTAFRTLVDVLQRSAAEVLTRVEIAATKKTLALHSSSGSSAFSSVPEHHEGDEHHDDAAAAARAKKARYSFMPPPTGGHHRHHHHEHQHHQHHQHQASPLLPPSTAAVEAVMVELAALKATRQVSMQREAALRMDVATARERETSASERWAGVAAELESVRNDAINKERDWKRAKQELAAEVKSLTALASHAETAAEEKASSLLTQHISTTKDNERIRIRRKIEDEEKVKAKEAVQQHRRKLFKSMLAWLKRTVIKGQTDKLKDALVGKALEAAFARQAIVDLQQDIVILLWLIAETRKAIATMATSPSLVAVASVPTSKDGSAATSATANVFAFSAALKSLGYKPPPPPSMAAIVSAASASGKDHNGTVAATHASFSAYAVAVFERLLRVCNGPRGLRGHLAMFNADLHRLQQEQQAHQHLHYNLANPATSAGALAAVATPLYELPSILTDPNVAAWLEILKFGALNSSPAAAPASSGLALTSDVLVLSPAPAVLSKALLRSAPSRRLLKASPASVDEEEDRKRKAERALIEQKLREFASPKGSSSPSSASKVGSPRSQAARSAAASVVNAGADAAAAKLRLADLPALLDAAAATGSGSKGMAEVLKSKNKASSGVASPSLSHARHHRHHHNDDGDADSVDRHSEAPSASVDLYKGSNSDDEYDEYDEGALHDHHHHHGHDLESIAKAEVSGTLLDDAASFELLKTVWEKHGVTPLQRAKWLLHLQTAKIPFSRHLADIWQAHSLVLDSVEELYRELERNQHHLLLGEKLPEKPKAAASATDTPYGTHASHSQHQSQHQHQHQRPVVPTLHFSPPSHRPSTHSSIGLGSGNDNRHHPSSPEAYGIAGKTRAFAETWSPPAKAAGGGHYSSSSPGSVVSSGSSVNGISASHRARFNVAGHSTGDLRRRSLALAAFSGLNEEATGHDVEQEVLGVIREDGEGDDASSSSAPSSSSSSSSSAAYAAVTASGSARARRASQMPQSAQILSPAHTVALAAAKKQLTPTSEAKAGPNSASPAAGAASSSSIFDRLASTPTASTFQRGLSQSEQLAQQALERLESVMMGRTGAFKVSGPVRGQALKEMRVQAAAFGGDVVAPAVAATARQTSGSTPSVPSSSPSQQQQQHQSYIVTVPSMVPAAMAAPATTVPVVPKSHYDEVINYATQLLAASPSSSSSAAAAGANPFGVPAASHGGSSPRAVPAPVVLAATAASAAHDPTLLKLTFARVQQLFAAQDTLNNVEKRARTRDRSLDKTKPRSASTGIAAMGKPVANINSSSSTKRSVSPAKRYYGAGHQAGVSPYKQQQQPHQQQGMTPGAHDLSVAQRFASPLAAAAAASSFPLPAPPIVEETEGDWLPAASAMSPLQEQQQALLLRQAQQLYGQAAAAATSESTAPAATAPAHAAPFDPSSAEALLSRIDTALARFDGSRGGAR